MPDDLETTSTAGIVDGVVVDLNGETIEGEHQEPDEPAKGPDPDHWGDEARAERGAEIPYVEPVLGDDGLPPKGPAPEVWGEEARADRGAETDTPLPELEYVDDEVEPEGTPPGEE